MRYGVVIGAVVAVVALAQPAGAGTLLLGESQWSGTAPPSGTVVRVGLDLLLGELAQLQAMRAGAPHAVGGAWVPQPVPAQFQREGEPTERLVVIADEDSLRTGVPWGAYRIYGLAAVVDSPPASPVPPPSVAPAPSPVPLPPALWTGLATLGMMGAWMWRRRTMP